MADSRSAGYHRLDHHALNRAREMERQERAEAQANARIDGEIDWSVCLVPGCGAALVRWSDVTWRGRQDSTMELPMCYLHAAVIWHRAIGGNSRDPDMLEAVADLNEKHAERTREIQAARQAEHLARTDGDIYFVRLNHLVKVGWTRDLERRIKSYGASVEVLVYYPGTRDDETALHRQLRPALAKGREWYEDGPIVQRFIDDALKQYGTPTLNVYWTKPKKDAVGTRRRR